MQVLRLPRVFQQQELHITRSMNWGILFTLRRSNWLYSDFRRGLENHLSYFGNWQTEKTVLGENVYIVASASNQILGTQRLLSLCEAIEINKRSLLLILVHCCSINNVTYSLSYCSLQQK